MGALERRGLFSRFTGRLDSTSGDLSSLLKEDLDLEGSCLSYGAAPAICISMEVHWSMLKLRQIPGVAGGFRKAGFMAARLIQVAI
ncbi:hypothetical protein MRX96_049188 [Rhipicephalus microplus]